MCKTCLGGNIKGSKRVKSKWIGDKEMLEYREKKIKETELHVTRTEKA